MQSAACVNLHVARYFTCCGVVTDLKSAIVSDRCIPSKAAVSGQRQQACTLLNQITLTADGTTPELRCAGVADQAGTAADANATAIVTAGCTTQRARSVYAERSCINRQISREQVSARQRHHARTGFRDRRCTAATTIDSCRHQQVHRCRAIGHIKGGRRIQCQLTRTITGNNSGVVRGIDVDG